VPLGEVEDIKEDEVSIVKKPSNEKIPKKRRNRNSLLYGSGISHKTEDEEEEKDQVPDLGNVVDVSRLTPLNASNDTSREISISDMSKNLHYQPINASSAGTRSSRQTSNQNSLWQSEVDSPS